MYPSDVVNVHPLHGKIFANCKVLGTVYHRGSYHVPQHPSLQPAPPQLVCCRVQCGGLALFTLLVPSHCPSHYGACLVAARKGFVLLSGPQPMYQIQNQVNTSPSHACEDRLLMAGASSEAVPSVEVPTQQWLGAGWGRAQSVR